MLKTIATVSPFFENLQNYTIFFGDSLLSDLPKYEMKRGSQALGKCIVTYYTIFIRFFCDSLLSDLPKYKIKKGVTSPGKIYCYLLYESVGVRKEC